ncbi:acyl carrier protein [Streptomyces sp. NPDC053429]|uniref:acyl carrier protein n=2 Tax=Streptomyces TaxID=1883 RepID=UPI0033D141D7
MTVPSALTGTQHTTADGGVLPHEWLMDRLSLYLRRAPESIDPGVPLAEYGMDSVAALSLCGDLEDEFGLEVEPTLLWDHPTVTALLRHLQQVLPAPAPAADALSAALAPARDQR